MSYILNALRKSDAQRRQAQGAEPDLAAPPANSSPRPRPSRLLTVLLPALVLAGLTGWFLAAPVQQWLAGREDPTESVPAEDSAVPAQAPMQAAGQGEDRALESPADVSPPTGTGPVVDRRSPAQQPVTVVSRPPPQPPTPRDRRDSPRPPVEREREVETVEELQRLIEDTQLAAESEAAAPVAPSAPPAQVVVEPPSIPAPEVEPWEPERSEFVRQWELPLSIRRDLPNLSLSIHVFSPDPERRFVLINGERRIEGETLGQGARLVEIRREGAVVEFRDYRFLLEP